MAKSSILAPILLLASACAPLVHRVDSADIEFRAEQKARIQAFLGRAAQRSSLQGTFNGERVVADSTTLENGCTSVLITYQDVDRSETWNRCRTSPFTQVRSQTERLPSGIEFEVLRHAVTQTANRLGKARLVFTDYLIEANTKMELDAQGCTLIDNVVTRDDGVVDARVDRICEEN